MSKGMNELVPEIMDFVMNQAKYYICPLEHKGNILNHIFASEMDYFEHLMEKHLTLFKDDAVDVGVTPYDVIQFIQENFVFKEFS